MAGMPGRVTLETDTARLMPTVVIIHFKNIKSFVMHLMPSGNAYIPPLTDK